MHRPPFARFYLIRNEEQVSRLIKIKQTVQLFCVTLGLFQSEAQRSGQARF